MARSLYLLPALLLCLLGGLLDHKTQAIFLGLLCCYAVIRGFSDD